MNYCTNYCDSKQLLQRHPLRNPPRHYCLLTAPSKLSRNTKNPRHFSIAKHSRWFKFEEKIHKSFLESSAFPLKKTLTTGQVTEAPEKVTFKSDLKAFPEESFRVIFKVIGLTPFCKVTPFASTLRRYPLHTKKKTTSVDDSANRLHALFSPCKVFALRITPGHLTYKGLLL